MPSEKERLTAFFQNLFRDPRVISAVHGNTVVTVIYGWVPEPDLLHGFRRESQLN